MTSDCSRAALRRVPGAEPPFAQVAAGMAPELDVQSYVFAVLVDGDTAPEFAFAVVREAEGTTVVLPIAGEGSDPRFARITLQVRSALEGVGLTAAVSKALADAGIACNVIAGLHHDHLFVPWNRREEALAILTRLSQDVRR